MTAAPAERTQAAKSTTSAATQVPDSDFTRPVGQEELHPTTDAAEAAMRMIATG